MRQLPLGISQGAEPAFDNFVAGRNAEALARVRELSAGTLGERIVYLWGERGSGCSHLLGAAARANPALVTVDDVETLDAQGQHALFVAINEGAAVLAAGARPPAQLGIRADLATRLASGLVYQLVALGDEDKARHLKSVAAERGLQLSDDIVGYLLTRLPRDMASLRSVMEVLDRYSLMRKRALTLPLVREALAEEILGGHPRNR